MPEHVTKDNHSTSFARYLAGLCTAFFFVLSSIAAINLTIDPANILLENEIQKIADQLERGNYISGISNLNETTLQLNRIALIKTPPETVVMGSSRAMGISRAIWPGNIKNHAISGAGIYQFCHIIEAYAAREILPRRMILVIDPWYFNASGQRAEDTHLDESCARFAPPSVQLDSRPNIRAQSIKALEFISFGYLKESIRRLQTNGADAVAPFWRRLGVNSFATSEPPLIKGGLAPDGSRIYPFKERNITAEELRAVAETYGKGDNAYNLGKFNELSPVFARTLENTLDFLTNANVTVIIALAPYHPVAARNLRNNPAYGPIIQKAESYLRSIASHHDIEILGGYFSTICDENEFFDPSHPRPSCMAKVFNNNLS